MDDPRLPVLIGVGQASQRSADLDSLVEPLDLMARAANAAVDDSGARRVGAALDRIVVVQGAWPYRDPGRLLADRLGAGRARTGLTTAGGESPMTALARLATEVTAGSIEAALVVGGEAIWSRRKLEQAGRTADVTRQADDVAPDEVFGAAFVGPDEHERSFGLSDPITTYPLFEVALRHDLGRTPAEHQAALGRLYSRFSEIAAANPRAWSRTALTPDQVATPTPDNRTIGYPYTKVMNSNWFTDQAAAVIVASAGWARAAGVPAERMVFLHATTKAGDTPLIGRRLDLHGSRSLRAAGPRAMELAGIGADDVAHVDLYSCFPVAVQVAARELGLGVDRDLTVTGGMSFHGGPLNNYTTHSVAEMVLRLRDHPGDLGLVVGNGGYLSKHAVMVLATEPPAAGYRNEDCQPAVDALPTHPYEPHLSGPVTVESYTVVHEGLAPSRAVAAVIGAGGERSFTSSTDPSVMAALMADDLVGTPAHVAADHVLHL